MNNERRSKIHKTLKDIEVLLDVLENYKDEEDEARDNMPESFESTDRYTHSEECSDTIESSIEDIREAISAIVDII